MASIFSLMGWMGGKAASIAGEAATIGAKVGSTGAKKIWSGGVLSGITRTGLWGVEKALGAYNNPALFGMSSLVGGKAGILARLAMPAVVGLVLGGFKAWQGSVGAAYSINSPRASWGSTPGRSGPGNYAMEFGSYQRGYIDAYASGNLMLSLHNLRKG